MNGSKKFIIVFISAFAFLISACSTDGDKGVITYFGYPDGSAVVTARYFLAGNPNQILVWAPVVSKEGKYPISNPDPDPIYGDYVNAITDGDVGLGGVILNADGLSATLKLSFRVDENTVIYFDHTATYDLNLKMIWTDVNYVAADGVVYADTVLYLGNILLQYKDADDILVYIQDASEDDFPTPVEPTATPTNTPTSTPTPIPTDTPTPEPTLIVGKITICHATANETNPYREITISFNGLNGHFKTAGSHDSDIIPAPEEGCPETAPPPSGEPVGNDDNHGQPEDTGKPDSPDNSESVPPTPPAPVNTPNNPPPPAPNNEEDGPGNQGDGGGKPDDAGGGKPDDAGSNGKGKNK